MTGILSLQNEYLSGTDSIKREQTLSDLYIELVKLGKYILKIKKFQNSPEDVYDIASDICCRLMERQVPVIKSAPSAYISSALYFKNKSTFHDSLEDIDEPSQESFEDSLFAEEELTETKEKVITYASSIVSDPYILQLIEETITYQMDCKDVKSHIKDPDDKASYSKAIRKIRQHLKEAIQC